MHLYYFQVHGLNLLFMEWFMNKLEDSFAGRTPGTCVAEGQPQLFVRFGLELDAADQSGSFIHSTLQYDFLIYGTMGGV
jgi:hypothetical protein